MPKIKVGKFKNMKEYTFMCPGCVNTHTTNETWKFNNNINKPTFIPSILVQYGNKPGDKRCHSYVTDGKIKYLNDCTHKLKGQTIELPEIS